MVESCVERQAPIEFCVARLDTVIASEAKQSMLPRSKSGLLRRFSPRNDVNSKRDSAISRRDAPEWCMDPSPKRGRGERRMLDAPEASRAKISEAHERSHYRSTGLTRRSHTQWF